MQTDIENTKDQTLKQLKQEWRQQWLDQKWLNGEEFYCEVYPNTKELNNAISQLKNDDSFTFKPQLIMQELKSFMPYYAFPNEDAEKWQAVIVNEETWHLKLSEINEQLTSKTEPQKTDVSEVPLLLRIIRAVSFVIWLVVVFVIFTHLVGTLSLADIHGGGSGTDGSNNNNPEVVAPSIPSQNEVNQKIAKALGKALIAAEESAEANLEQWQKGVMERIDDPFLEDYYGYFNQLKLGLKGSWIQLTSQNDQEKAQRLIADFQERFANQVMQPTIMELQMQRFLQEAVEAYTNVATEQLEAVRAQYYIPQPEWEKYLEDLGKITFRAGGKNQDLSLRVLTRGGGYIATTTLFKAVPAIGTKVVIGKTGSKVVTKLATKAAVKVGTKAFGGTGVLIGLELLNPLVGVGVLAWDVWDHYHTVSVEKPQLREKLATYIDELKFQLLNDTDNGLLSSIKKFHYEVMDTNLKL